MIFEHLPALQVVLPLVSAPLIVLVRRQTFAWLLATAVSWAALAIAIALASRVADGGPSPMRSAAGRRPGDRVPRRRAQRIRAGTGVAYRRCGHAVCAGKHRGGAAARARVPVLRDVLSLPGGAARHHDHRRRLQSVCVPGDLVALHVRPDRPGTATQGAVRCVPVPRHGNDRCHVLRDRDRAALPDDRYPQPCRSRRAPAGGEGGPSGARRAGLHHGRDRAEARAFSAASMVAERLCVRPVARDGVPRGDCDQGLGLRARSLLLHGVR